MQKLVSKILYFIFDFQAMLFLLRLNETAKYIILTWVDQTFKVLCCSCHALDLIKGFFIVALHK